MRRRDTAQLGEELLLHVEVLDDRFDHQMAIPEVGKPGNHFDAHSCGSGGIFRHAAFFCRADKQLFDEIAGFLRGAFAAVGDQYLHSAGRRYLGNTAPHGAGADDTDGQFIAIHV